MPGRWRGRRHGLLSLFAAWCGWSWLGLEGAVLLSMWWWQQRPGPLAGRIPEYWIVDPLQARSVRLGFWRTRIVLRGSALEIFHDEISAADLARLRRVLKTSALGAPSRKYDGV